MKSFDWEDLRHFAALAGTLNLSGAAAALNTSQVTVMRRVRVLEATLGVALFVRRRDGHRLTVAGAKLLSLAQDARDIIDGVPAAIGISDASGQGNVRIATTELGANWLLLPHIAEFRNAHPGITLEIDASPRSQDLLEDTETLALRFVRPKAGSHVIKKLGALPFAIYLAPKLLSAVESPEAREGGDGLPYIGWDGPFAEISVAKWLRSSFGGRPPVLSLTTLHGHIEAARLGIGATALPILIGGQFPDLVQAKEIESSFSLDIWLVVPAQIRKIARVRVVTKFVERAVRKTLDSTIVHQEGRDPKLESPYATPRRRL